MLHLSSILVPLDGSRFAEQALPLAEQFARSSGASLRLVLVHAPAATWDPGLEFSLFDLGMEEKIRRREMSYLEALAGRLASGGGLQVEHSLLNGSIAEALEEYVERTGTDLVILTSHGRGGIGRLVLGNVADQLVHRLHIPVLVIRPEEKKRAPVQAAEARRILVPLDGSNLAASVLDQAKQFARITGSELLLLSIVQPTPVLVPPFVWQPEAMATTPEDREVAAREYLDRIQAQLRGEGLVVDSCVHHCRKVAREILQVARDERCSLIAIATHGASGLDRMMLGSVADQVVRHADLPVLILRPSINDESEFELVQNAAEAVAAK